MTMKSHLKPLLIRAKVEGVTINKVLVDCGATVNIMPHHILTKIIRSKHNSEIVLKSANLFGMESLTLGRFCLQMDKSLS